MPPYDGRILYCTFTAAVNTPVREKKLPITQSAESAAALKSARDAYNENKLRAAQRSIHILIAIASVVNFLFLVCDLIYIDEQTGRLTAAIARYTFSILLILMTRVLQNVRSFSSFSAIVTALESLSVVLYLYVLWQYDSPQFMIQSMGMISSILVFFIVPNRNWNMLALSICGTAAYFVMSFFCFPELSLKELVVAIIYSSLTILLCAVTVFSNERYTFREFIAKTRLEQTSTTDFLTNAATRARLEEEARRWMSFCRRQGLPLCMVFADVDNLKYINDHFGHAAGDVVLKQLAELMKTQLRNSDTIARWGGDEFVLLLPNVSLNNAMLLLDRIKQAVSQINLNNGVTISCSYGVVEMGPESTYQQMLTEADALMYRSKRSGKEKLASNTMQRE